MSKHLKRLGGQIVGWFFILLGIAGICLPLLHGILFLFIGLLILSKTSPWATKVLHKLENRFPNLSKRINKWRKHPKWGRLLPDDR
ncbi:PGPGW domain-containing protein [Paludifilum halophilum]|uniref:Uncharacterized protein n=1 Tax=Paludifilum halophilum TaxID=1642702 RepID=A0A235B664_9BACL|nr:PGPGW domain-containing protein [Paludifilum halophilum]OYD07721.1 hypothetical protein CHM34_09615 [Paludifilum halophilum]